MAEGLDQSCALKLALTRMAAQVFSFLLGVGAATVSTRFVRRCEAARKAVVDDPNADG